MGFAKYYEDIQDRYWESGSLPDLGFSRPLPPPPSDPLDRPRRVIKDFWAYYHSERGEAEIPPGCWEQHFQNVHALHEILSALAVLHESDPGAWDAVCHAERRVRELFHSTPTYGPLSRGVIDRVGRISRDIQARCAAVERELGDFIKTVNRMSGEEQAAADLVESIEQLRQIRDRLNQDLLARRRYDAMAREAAQHWQRFLRLFSVLAVQRRYRPALQNLDRLRLNEQQDRFVALDHEGEYRVQGASGSGKTVILIHRALRLAAENPAGAVRIFTINRALADLIRSSIAAINRTVPDNIHVAAFYDFLLDCVSLFEPRERYRLVDDLSGERITLSWRDFFNHRGKDESQNIFASPAIRDLVQSIEGRGTLNVDAGRYLRDEMVYIQSAFRVPGRHSYITAPRRERSIPLLKFQRAVSLQVLEAWEEWLRCGDLCDIDGLTLQAAEHFHDGSRLCRIRAAFPTDFVLIDEVQDFSTLELSIARRLVPEPDGTNRFFLVGDLNQKVYTKHHDSVWAGFNFRGKAAILSQNFRNTKQILRAAYCIPATFPPQTEEALEVGNPDYSIYEGGKPVTIACTEATHADRIVDLIHRRRNSRVAVVSENDRLLMEVRRKAAGRGYRCYELFRNEDLDLWKQQGDPLSAAVVVSRMEAVKGFEFDTVIVCDLSDGVVPRRGTPRDEYWREAAVVYCALTRARDELVITYVGQPSVFLHVMEPEIEMHAGPDEHRFKELLGQG